MPQPTPFHRDFSFTDYQASQPSDPLPGFRLDAQLDAVEQTLTGVLGDLALIQRDDGLLADGCVTVDSISAELLAAIAAAAPPGPQGNPGGQGAPGNPGANAPNPAFTVVTNTLAPGAAATAAVTGAYPNLTLTFGIPKGDAAEPGAATLAVGDYGDVLVSAAGSNLKVETVLGGSVPSVIGHTHVIADVPGLQAALDAKQPTGSYSLTTHSHTLADLQAWGLLADGSNETGRLVYVQADGGVEVGWYIDFHNPDGTADYKVRMSVDVSANINFQSAASLAVGGTAVSLVGHPHAIADVVGLTAALAGKQAAGAYATTGQLAGKADAFTVVPSFDFDLNIVDAQNGQYLIKTGANPRTFTFGSPTAGLALILVNRGSVNVTIACAGGYYKNGAAAPATVNLTLVPGGKLTAFHEGAGVWAFDGTGF